MQMLTCVLQEKYFLFPPTHRGVPSALKEKKMLFDFNFLSNDQFFPLLELPLTQQMNTVVSDKKHHRHMVANMMMVYSIRSNRMMILHHPELHMMKAHINYRHIRASAGIHANK